MTTLFDPQHLERYERLPSASVPPEVFQRAGIVNSAADIINRAIIPMKPEKTEFRAPETVANLTGLATHQVVDTPHVGVDPVVQSVEAMGRNAMEADARRMLADVPDFPVDLSVLNNPELV